MTTRPDLMDLIFSISPTTTPVMSYMPHARVQKRNTGGSMRQRRRAMMKPLRFTPQLKGARIHEWRLDA